VLRRMRAKKALATVRAVEEKQECDIEKVKHATQYLGISAGPSLLSQEFLAPSLSYPICSFYAERPISARSGFAYIYVRLA